jgi:Immunoglobulin I-set domain
LKASATKYQMDAKKDGIHTLTILKGDTTDEGQYTIVVENVAGKVQADAKVTVCTKPKIDKFTDAAVNIGEIARISCVYSGQPNPTIAWFKDGKAIPTDDQRITITQESPALSVLVINNTTMDDKGVYSVKLTNSAGDVEGKANLNVKRKFE